MTVLLDTEFLAACSSPLVSWGGGPRRDSRVTPSCPLGAVELGMGTSLQPLSQSTQKVVTQVPWGPPGRIVVGMHIDMIIKKWAKIRTFILPSCGSLDQDTSLLFFLHSCPGMGSKLCPLQVPHSLYPYLGSTSFLLGFL